jgi:acyl-CoA synthetase (AMP-forming)/AMP-acid ligase II
MMSAGLSAASGAPEDRIVPGKVFRTELNPVDFLERAAYIYPGKTAVVDGERRYSYRELAERSWRLANALRSAGLDKGDRVATLLFNSSAMLERISACRRRAGSWSRSITACRPPRSDTSCSTAARNRYCSTPRWRRWPSRPTCPA